MRRVLIAVGILVILGLGYAHWILPARVEGRMNINLPHDPYRPGDSAKELHQGLFVADLHTDSLLWNRDFARRSARGHMDLPRLQDGNVALQVFSATTKSPKGQNYEKNEANSDQITPLVIAQFWPPKTWNSIYERAVFQLEKLKSLADSTDLTLVTTRQDMENLIAARESGSSVIGAVYLIEGAHPLEGNIENLDRLYQQGLRIVGLTHFFDNEAGGSLHGVSGAGLSDFGREIVDRADELQLIIDIAHASPAMVREVLEQSSRPVILSHGGIKGICDTPRNLDDELMLEVAEHGGLIGIGFWDAAICDITPAGVVKAIRYAIDLLGAEHVALGSDYDGATAVSFDAGELAVLTDEMIKQGFSAREIRLVMGDNVKQFMLDNLPD